MMNCIRQRKLATRECGMTWGREIENDETRTIKKNGMKKREWYDALMVKTHIRTVTSHRHHIDEER